MKLTGHADFQFNEAQNFSLEKLPELPIFDLDFLGRLVFISPIISPNFGLWLGTESGWQRVGSSESICQYEFMYLNFETHNAGVDFVTILNRPYDIVLQKGFLFAVNVMMELPLVNGDLLVRPTRNGSLIITNALDVLLDSGGQAKRVSTVYDNINFYFAENDHLGWRLFGNAGVLPEIMNVRLMAWLYLD